jgi:pseudouridine synthase
LTNDGELAYAVTHPRHHIPKTYIVSVKGTITNEKLNQLQKGIMLEDGLTAPCQITITQQTTQGAVLEIILYQGRKRQIRRMCRAVGLQVVTLHRVAIGSLQLGDLKQGEYRPLTNDEIQMIKQDVNLTPTL